MYVRSFDGDVVVKRLYLLVVSSGASRHCLWKGLFWVL